MEWLTGWVCLRSWIGWSRIFFICCLLCCVDVCYVRVLLCFLVHICDGGVMFSMLRYFLLCLCYDISTSTRTKIALSCTGCNLNMGYGANGSMFSLFSQNKVVEMRTFLVGGGDLQLQTFGLELWNDVTDWLSKLLWVLENQWNSYSVSSMATQLWYHKSYACTWQDKLLREGKLSTAFARHLGGGKSEMARPSWASHRF